MKKPLFRLCATLLTLCLPWSVQAATEVRLAVHDSFDLPKTVLAKFEAEHDAKIAIIKMGDGNEMLNRLILTRGQSPLADAVFGLDNNTVHKAHEMGILAAKQPKSQAVLATLPHALAVDFGFVTLNYDKKWFADKKLPLPKTLDDLSKPQYKDLLVMPNPGTSTPGLAFLTANIGYLGEDKAFAFWAKMRQNGVKITKGWSDAYYTEFTLNGGSRPMMVGYASSPAAEVFYSEGKLTTPNMGNLFLKGGSQFQVEGAAVLNHAKEPLLAAKLVQYLQGKEVQEAVFTSMWVYPAVKNTKHPAAIVHASVPQGRLPRPENTAHKQKDWVARWVRTVLK
ncbi:MAG: thiamine ABC transporter substrate-binding protein [Alysiella sp.]|uniref:thiamine ABC transporter substrate-binding protein n=1 Tax=Alysiella sp. TaxID=1872483 RepID=UPI0026DBF43B|nr:thiamine ABC transporter substrate-binding protein [Alysiella sp.]MDO4434061.1 thiamine ABC transporter substrate-binding protein [Alysiella sp.]